MRTRRRRLLARAGLGLLAVAVLVQLVPLHSAVVDVLVCRID
jgi:hypothetical protein